MNLSAPFIVRPVATVLLMTGLLLCGLATYPLLPVGALPNVNYPTIQISAQLPGADPETMASSVATPLERQLGQIPGVTQLTSSQRARLWRSSRVQFELAVAPWTAPRQDVLAAINADRRRPADRTCPIRRSIRKVNPAETPILLIALTSDSYPLTTVDAYAENILLAQDCLRSPASASSASAASRSQPSGSRSIRRRWPRAGSALKMCATSSRQRMSICPRVRSQQPARDLHAQYQRPVAQARSL